MKLAIKKPQPRSAQYYALAALQQANADLTEELPTLPVPLVQHMQQSKQQHEDVRKSIEELYSLVLQLPDFEAVDKEGLRIRQTFLDSYRRLEGQMYDVFFEEEWLNPDYTYQDKKTPFSLLLNLTLTLYNLTSRSFYN